MPAGSPASQPSATAESDRLAAEAGVEQAWQRLEPLLHAGNEVADSTRETGV